MRGFYSVLPTLSPDFSGVCSTLFELDGIVVIHDAGGCTGTYTGYDEPRWFDQRSRIFTSNLDDAEAVFGDDGILLDKVISADECLDGAFFALLGSPSPAVLGTDYQALARLVSKRTGKKTMSFSTKGMEFYDRGVAAALLGLAKTFLPGERPAVCPRSVNLLGATPLDLTHRRNVDAIRGILEGAGFYVRAVWAMGSTLEEIGGSLAAQCNVALTVSALPLCRYLEARYGMPYLVGSFSGERPVSHFLTRLEALAQGVPADDGAGVTAGDGLRALVVGEQLLSNGVREALEQDCGFAPADVCTFFDADPTLQRPGDQGRICEGELEERIRSGRYDVIVGDALLRELDVPESPRRFVELPHVAVSSRLGWTSPASPFGARLIRQVRGALEEQAG